MHDIVAINAQRIIKEKGLIQKSVAKKMNLTENQLTSIFKGRKIITTSIVLKFCEVLDVSPNDLYGYDKSA